MITTHHILFFAVGYLSGIVVTGILVTALVIYFYRS